MSLPKISMSMRPYAFQEVSGVVHVKTPFGSAAMKHLVAARYVYQTLVICYISVFTLV